MSFFKSIKNAFGGSDDEDYDVFGQPTTFVNPFSKDKNVPGAHEQEKEEVPIKVDGQEEFALDAEFADKAVRLMNDHTHAVIDLIKGTWKTEREQLLAQMEEAKKFVDEAKEKMQVGEANRRQAQTRAEDLTNKVADLEAELDKVNVDKKSLESRLKAMEVRGEGADELNKKVEEQEAVIEDLKKQIEDKDAEIERLDNLVNHDGPTIEELNQQIQQRDELVENLRGNVAELEERLNAAAEDLKAAEELQKAVEQVEEFKEKKVAEISSLRQQVSDLQQRASEFDELRKAHIILKEENEGLQKNIEQLEQTAKQNAEVTNRRSIETGNLIDGLKQQLASANALAEDYKRRFNSLSADGNEKQANFAKITAERDDAKAELKRMQVTLSKKQHEAQAMNDAIVEKDRRIAALTQELEQLKANASQRPAAATPYGNDVPYEEDPAIKDAVAEIDDIDWVDDGNQPPHPGEDPRQLSLF